MAHFACPPAATDSVFLSFVCMYAAEGCMCRMPDFARGKSIIVQYTWVKYNIVIDYV